MAALPQFLDLIEFESNASCFAVSLDILMSDLGLTTFGHQLFDDIFWIRLFQISFLDFCLLLRFGSRLFS